MLAAVVLKDFPKKTRRLIGPGEHRSDQQPFSTVPDPKKAEAMDAMMSGRGPCLAATQFVQCFNSSHKGHNCFAQNYGAQYTLSRQWIDILPLWSFLEWDRGQSPGADHVVHEQL